jgi:signal transduction histidine kinase
MPLTIEHKELLQKSIVSLEEAASNLDSVRSELQDTFDDLSTAAQDNDKGVNLTAVIETLEETHGETERIISSLYDLTQPPTPKKRTK